jgi:hypothetical protein
MERYSGTFLEGIDYIPLGEEHANPGIMITQPKEKHLYIAGEEIQYLSYLPKTIILGKIDVETEVNADLDVDRVEFYLGNRLQYTDEEKPYIWSWTKRSFFRYQIVTKVFFNDDTIATDGIIVWKFF